MRTLKVDIKIPGFLVIDTPGHEAFVNLRRRGGSIADIAVLVIDALEGFEEITYESLRILRERKVPFVVAVNKIDRIIGWKSHEYSPFTESFKLQSPETKRKVEELVYRIVNQFYKEGFEADRYDRVKDFAKTIAIVPTSAMTGEGISDLLLVLAGLTQKYMIERLRTSKGPAKGVVLECRELPGLGAVVDVIIHEGNLKQGDLIVLGGLTDPLVTKVRALLLPKPLDEMRDPEDKFKLVEEVNAACGVRIVAPNLEGAIAGSPLLSTSTEVEVEKLKKAVSEEMATIRFSREAEGVVVKADTLGSLEAIVEKLKMLGIPVRIADIGPIAKRDVIEASLVKEVDKTLGVILAFNVKTPTEVEDEIKSRGLILFSSNVIYKLFEEYQDWVSKLKEEERKKELQNLIRPGKIKLLPKYVFRRSGPAIVGVEVQVGRIRPGYPLIREDGKVVGSILQIQDRGKSIEEALKGLSVAISIKEAIVGRQIREGDVLYVNVPEEHIKLLTSKYKGELSEEEVQVLMELKKVRTRLS